MSGLPIDGNADAAPGKEILSRTAEAAKHAVRAGQFAPTFRLQDLHSGSAALIDWIDPHPLVISFYRGSGFPCRFWITAVQ